VAYRSPAVLNVRQHDGEQPARAFGGQPGKQQKSKNRSHGLPESQRIALDHRSLPGLAGCRVQCVVLKGTMNSIALEKRSGLSCDHSHEDMIEPRG
jgi:hypothetical protein